MPTIRAGDRLPLGLDAGKVLTVTCDSVSSALMRTYPSNTQGIESNGSTAIAAGTSVSFGPYLVASRFQLEGSAGTVSYSVGDDQPESPLEKPIVGTTAAQASFTSLVSRAGKVPGSMIAIGDSLTARQATPSGVSVITLSTSFLAWGNAFLGGVFSIEAKGVSGDTTAQMLARWPTDVTPSTAERVHILGLGNDVSNGVLAGDEATPGTIIYNLAAMIALAKAEGRFITIGTQYPFTSHTTAARRAALHAANAWIRSQASEQVRVADYYYAMVDALGAIRPNVLVADAIHPSARGASLMGRVFALTHDDTPRKTYMLSSSAFDAGQGLPNGALEGNNAGGANGFTLGTGFTGTGPRGWGWSRTGAAIVATVSKQARSGNTYSADYARCVIGTTGADYDIARLERTFSYRAWSSGGTANNARRFYVASTGAQYDVLVDGNFAAGADPTATWPIIPGSVFTDGTATLICITPAVVGSRLTMHSECVVSGISVGTVQPSIQLTVNNSAGSAVASVDGLAHTATQAVAPLPEEVGAGLVLSTPNLVIPAGFDLSSTTSSAGPTFRIRLDLVVVGGALATVDWGRVTIRTT